MSPVKASPTARERARAELTREIKEEARKQLAETGAQGLSLRGPKVRLDGIPGAPPDLANPPAGCRFAPRCSRVEARCTATEVPLYSVNGSLVRCVLQKHAE